MDLVQKIIRASTRDQPPHIMFVHFPFEFAGRAAVLILPALRSERDL